MEDVELDRSHAVKGTLDNGDGLEVTAAVDHQATPAETGCVVNADNGDDIAAAGGLHELDEGFKTVHGSDFSWRVDFRAGESDSE
jgi:hypothetical protein